jgi:two-component system chemotaxis response regulator CheB
MVVVGASAGGVEALIALAKGLPADLRLAFAVVLHMPAGANSRLAEILNRAGPLPALVASHGSAPSPGTIYVAPPDHHLVFSDERMYLLEGARENGFRPAIDPLFRSAASTFGARATGIILSGTMDDGAAGLAAIQSFGGATIVQEPRDALASGMPEAALELIRPDHVVRAADIGALLAAGPNGEARSGANAGRAASGNGRRAQRVVTADPTLTADPMTLPPHGVDIACPECGGALQGIVTGPMTRFRCRTGHIYSPVTLLDTKAVELEAALWAALRALEEEATIAGRLAARARENGADSAASRFERRQGDAAARADLVQHALHQIGEATDGAPDGTVAPPVDPPAVPA